jgi:Endonuclease/Exonuclease/phosphatase family
VAWRFATWNVDFHRRNPQRTSRAKFIASHRPDVIALQETRGWEARQVAEECGLAVVHSLDLWPDAKGSWMGCAILFSDEFNLLDAGVVTTLPKPQRSVWARFRLRDDTEVTVVSWHAPNRAGDGLATKMAAYEAMGAWLTRAPRPLALGVDLNAWRDPVELIAALPGEEHEAEHAFVGPDPAHGLIDGWRTVLADTGKMQGLPAEGPLAVSKVLDSGATYRMDRIYVSPGLSPVQGGYDLHGAIDAGSDHALHWLDLKAESGKE